MDAQQVFTFGQQGLYMLMLVAAPILIVVLAVAGPWMLSTLVEYIRTVLLGIPAALG